MMVILTLTYVGIRLDTPSGFVRGDYTTYILLTADPVSTCGSWDVILLGEKHIEKGAHRMTNVVTTCERA